MSHQFNKDAYNYKLKLEDEQSFTSIIFNSLGQNLNILELGACDGGLGKYLSETKSAKVIGLDIDKKESQRISECVIIEYCDLDRDESFAEIKRISNEHGIEQYDAILILAVLEHLRRPDLLLSELKKILTKDGLIFVSLPNIAHHSIRKALLFGHFDYSNRGILDRTHLRFFTLKTARELLANAGYNIIQTHYEIEDIKLIPLINKGSPYHYLKKISAWIAAAYCKITSPFTCYQVLMIAKIE